MGILGWVVASTPAVLWTALLCAPWRPWSTREHLESDRSGALCDLSGVTALIPARNEADVIDATLTALHAQGRGLQALVIDDQSCDATARLAARHANTRVLEGRPLPDGWSGKLWALEQGRAQVHTALTLLLDADIELQPGLLAALLEHKQRDDRQLVSLMADLGRGRFWDSLLLPVFVYYFKLLYPFRLSNSAFRHVAAAAGGCVLVDTQALTQVGAFASLRDALIDDCSLARRVKRAGFRTWLGLSRDVRSLRRYGTFGSIRDMVARSAFTQLGYSGAALVAVTFVFALVYGLPLALLGTQAWSVGLVALLAMMLSYVPTLRYYRMSPAWSVLLPASAMLYLAMTWTSAVRYWRGTRSQWRGRTYLK